MAWIDDLYKSLGVHSGSWSVLGIPLPDLGITEAAAYVGSDGSTTDLSDAATGNYTWKPTTSTTGGGGGGGGGGGADPGPGDDQYTTRDSSGSLASETDRETDRETDEERAERKRQEFIKEQKALAQARWQAGIDTARRRLSTADTYRNEMKGILGNKRGEFEKMFDEAAGQIGVGAAQRTGEAGRMAQDMATSAGNRARALGLTGTTAMQMLNKPNDAHARDFFNISQEKSKNENENRRLLGDRQDWATGQEADLDQYYKNVMDEVANLEKMSYLNYWNDLSGLGNQIDSSLQNMINTQNQMALMQSGIQGYDTSAMNPTFSNTMSALQGLSSGLNTTQMPQTADPGANSLVAENEYLKLLRGVRS